MRRSLSHRCSSQFNLDGNTKRRIFHCNDQLLYLIHNIYGFDAERMCRSPPQKILKTKQNEKFNEKLNKPVFTSTTFRPVCLKATSLTYQNTNNVGKSRNTFCVARCFRLFLQGPSRIQNRSYFLFLSFFFFEVN